MSEERARGPGGAAGGRVLAAVDGEEREEEEDDIALPPLDAGDEDEPDEPEALDDLDGDPDDGGDDPLDDAEASDLDTGIDVGADDPDSNDGDADGFDDGAIDDGPDDEAGDAIDDDRTDELAGSDEIDIAEGEELDDGAEGTSDVPEDEIDEAALPELDADDEGEDRESDLAETLLAEADSPLPPWEAARWLPLEGAGAAVPCTAVTVGAGRVVAAGQVVLVVDEGARAVRRAALGAGVTSVAVTEEALLAVTGRGHVLISDDGGATARPLAGLRSAAGTLALAATPGRMWIVADGALLAMSSPSKAPVTVRSRGVTAVTAGGGVLVALTSTAEGPVIERFRNDDEGWSAIALAASARSIAETGGVQLAAAAQGTWIALSDESRLAVSRDGGVRFRVLDLGPIAALAFAGDEGEAPLLCLVGGGGGQAAYVVQVPAAGEPTRVAEVPGTGGDEPPAVDGAGVVAPLGPAPMGIAWDAAREVAWIACRAGLLALGRARKH